MNEPRTDLGKVLVLITMPIRIWLWMLATLIGVDEKERELLGRAWER